MPKILEFEVGSGFYYFYCPGCKIMHQITVGRPNFNGARWLFDGNFDNPTITPSFFTSWQGSMHDTPRHVCHLFVTSGKINYLSDSTHRFSGQTIDMEEVE